MGFQSRTVFRNPPVALLLETFALGSQPGHQSLCPLGRKKNNPPYSTHSARNHQPSVLFKAVISNIFINYLGMCEGWKHTMEVYLYSEYICTYTCTGYSVNVVKELQDNEAKFKVCMVYCYAIWGPIAAFSIFFPDWQHLLTVHTQIWPELASMKVCESRQ